MIKVYLLLRNNKQSGPFSLDEIAEQQLKPLDLIWIEGKSAAWRYASEVTELATFLPGSQPANPSHNQRGDHDAYLPKSEQANIPDSTSAPKKIHVSLPANAAAKKENPVQPVQAPVPLQKPEAEPSVARSIPVQPVTARANEPKEKLVTKFSSTLEEKEEAYTEWIYKSKSRKNTLAPEWIGGIAVIILLMMGSAAYYIKNRTADKSEITQSTIPDARAIEEVTSTQPEPESQEMSQPAPAQAVPETVIPEAPLTAGNQAVNAAVPLKSAPAKLPATTKTAEKPKMTAPQNTAKNTGVAIKEEPIVQASRMEEPVITNNQKTSKTSTPEAETVKQKKTFSEKVDGFFNKVIRAKKVEPGMPAGSPEPAAPAEERKVVRRGETTATESETAKKDLSAGMQVTTIEPTNTWMQGVHGLRMKIENKNDVKVSNASVEVKYLNDQNAVIEKKTIRLSAIAPGKQIVMDIPDHRLADHATATLISANN